MNQFRNCGDLFFNGKRYYQYKIVSIGEADLEFNLGLSRTIETEEINDKVIVSKIKNNCSSLEVIITKQNEDNSEITKEEYEYICKELFIDEEACIYSEGINYRGIFISAIANEENNTITLQFQMTEPFAIRKNLKSYFYSVTEKIEDIIYEKTYGINEKIYPDILFNVIEGTAINMSISNIKGISSMQLNNLIPGHSYKFISEIKQVIDTKTNELIFCRDFIYLYKDKNLIKINSNGKVDITISYKDKVALR